MTTYSWNSEQGGDWNDANNWLNVTTGKVDDGVPGAGDTAFSSRLFTNVDGVTVENLYTGGEIIGDITVTGIANVGDFTGGVVKVGTDQGGTFDGTSLTAEIIENTTGVTNGFPVLEAGRVTANLLAEAKIEGASVTAKSIAEGPVGLAVAVTVESGSLGAGALTLVDGGSFGVDGGSVTISGAATVDGSGSNLGVSGSGQLDFKKSLTLSDGAFCSLDGGTTTVAGNLGDTGSGSFTVSQSARLTVAGGLTVGADASGSGTLTVTGSSGAMTVAGNATVGKGSSVYVFTGGKLAIKGDLFVFPGSLTEMGGTLDVGGTTIIGDGGGGSGSTALAAAAGPSVVAKVTLSGGSETWKGPVAIGDGATGMLTVEAGAVVTADSNWIVGDLRHGPGKVTVTGKGSQLSEVRTLTIGKDGKGVLVVADHADVGFSVGFVVGDDRAGSGKVTIGGGATVSSDEGVADVGFSGKGTLTIGGAGTLSPHLMGIGVNAGGSGTVSLGAGAKLLSDDLSMGILAQSHGTLNVGANATVAIKSDATIGDSGSGSLTVANGGRVTIGGELQVGAQGSIQLAGGGAISVGSGASFKPGFVAIFKGGDVLLHGRNGSYRAETLIGGGTLEVAASGAAGTGDIVFSGAGGTVELAKGVRLANTIFGFGKGDTIELLSTTANSARFSGGVLTVKNAKTTVATLDFSGSYASANFKVVTDTDGTAMISYVASGRSADLAEFRRFGDGGAERETGGSGLDRSQLLPVDGPHHTILGFR